MLDLKDSAEARRLHRAERLSIKGDHTPTGRGRNTLGVNHTPAADSTLAKAGWVSAGGFAGARGPERTVRTALRFDVPPCSTGAAAVRG